MHLLPRLLFPHVSSSPGGRDYEEKRNQEKRNMKWGWFHLSGGSIKQCNEQTINHNDAIKLLAKPFRSCLLNMMINWSLNGEIKATEGFTIRCLMETVKPRFYRIQSEELFSFFKSSDGQTWLPYGIKWHSLSAFSDVQAEIYSRRPLRLKHQTGTCWLSHLWGLMGANEQQGTLSLLVKMHACVCVEMWVCVSHLQWRLSWLCLSPRGLVYPSD